ncbi:hypothetical protein OIU76_001988 [Salix suchowensis]|nr:hypothetical protein OIU76_001988 [Salix suchowensis]
MRLFTHNMLSSNIKGVANGFPLRIEAEQVLEKQVDFNPDFLRNLFPKLEWKALVDGARALGYAELPEAADSSMLESEEFLRKVHHALLELHLEEGALTCPETGRKFPVNKGIPNMLLHEDEGPWFGSRSAQMQPSILEMTFSSFKQETSLQLPGSLGSHMLVRITGKQ